MSSVPQFLQDELAERSVQLEKVRRAARDLVSTDESPSLKAVDILCAAGVCSVLYRSHDDKPHSSRSEVFLMMLAFFIQMV